EEFHMDQWNVDVTVSASQKALMLPPGLGFISFSRKAEKLLDQSVMPCFYFDLRRYVKSGRDNNSPFTPNIMAILQLERSLEMIRKEGLKKIQARHALYSRAVREAMKAMGLKLLNEKSRGNVCTAVLLPRSISSSRFLSRIKDKYNVIFAPGQDGYAETMFRIGHVGYVNTFDIITAVSACEMGLRNMGCKLELGKGVRAAEKILTAG
ncbi:MAG: aminotransferase class V-fold PLP-dependent enzyme, partial [bacterium]|nr:aminotransferase class V-fold PLP-dependent enzyme [bacterium]